VVCIVNPYMSLKFHLYTSQCIYKNMFVFYVNHLRM
jgi:hypothetical protein